MTEDEEAAICRAKLSELEGRLLPLLLRSNRSAEVGLNDPRTDVRVAELRDEYSRIFTRLFALERPGAEAAGCTEPSNCAAVAGAVCNVDFINGGRFSID